MGLYPPLATGKCESWQHIKEKGTMYWGGGKRCFFAATGGQAKELGGQLPPSLYVKRGPESLAAGLMVSNIQIRLEQGLNHRTVLERNSKLSFIKKYYLMLK